LRAVTFETVIFETDTWLKLRDLDFIKNPEGQIMLVLKSFELGQKLVF